MDTFNKFMVGSQGSGGIVILRPPTMPLTKEEALIFAAWIVTLAADDDAEFQQALDAVRS